MAILGKRGEVGKLQADCSTSHITPKMLGWPCVLCTEHAFPQILRLFICLRNTPILKVEETEMFGTSFEKLNTKFSKKCQPCMSQHGTWEQMYLPWACTTWFYGQLCWSSQGYLFFFSRFFVLLWCQLNRLKEWIEETVPKPSPTKAKQISQPPHNIHD